MPRWRATWMDQGGTFTDVVRVADDGTVRLDKVLSDRADLDALGAGAPDVRRGTTVATNALLEGTGRPVVLLINRGLGDLPELGDQSRAELFSLAVTRPTPPCGAVLEVEGRIAADGRVLAPAAVDPAALAALRARGFAAAAVVLAHGPLAPEEERRLGAACRAAGFSQVSLGHAVAPSRGLLDRLTTTLVDAAVSPLLPRAPGHYLRSDGGLAREGLPGARPGEWRGCDAVLSGPAGGVLAVADLARRLGLGPTFGLDMGGTSADVCRVEGAPERADHLEVGGLRLRVPAVRLETVAAGGGSRLAVRAGMYAVGPGSAGAEPGPACYGRGGPAAVTDCEAVLGRLPGFPEVCGAGRDQGLDRPAARAALAALDPSRPVEQVAAGFVAVAHAVMAGAIRRLAAARGVDPADHALVAFGGAGPGHACGVARMLGIRRVVVPALAGALSAVGIGRAARRAEVVRGVHEGIAAAARSARAAQPFAGATSLRLAARYAGTTAALEVPLADPPEGRELDAPLRAAFEAAHRRRFGFARPGHAVEAVEVRLAVEEPLAAAPTEALGAVPATGRTVRAWFDGWRSVPWEPARAARHLAGPALLSADGATVVLPEGWVATWRDGALTLTDRGAPPPRLDLAHDPAALATFASRLQALAEQMGERLQRLARSVSIRERRDFSCAVFDRAGRLVVNAPHVPVHLGAMGETVRALAAARGEAVAPGTVWASNDPYAGGSHLPDVTVMQPVFVAGERVAWVACRGHHIDVGGVQPGSMPPFSTTLAEEGVVLRHVQLVGQGRFTAPDLGDCREPDTVVADLEAQVAACAVGAQGVAELVATLGADRLATGFATLLERSRKAAAATLRTRSGLARGREVLDDGHVLETTLEIHADGARLRLEAGAHPGNLNAPTAVARAAVLYVLRCWMGGDLPLNEGALDAVRVEVTPGGLLDPQPPAAVAGGNVETSQRIVDALLASIGACAPSQGTMNNLTVGTPAGAWYETIAGGAGAGPGFPGGSAVQVHMTNTRATDLEELEHRFPVRLERWSRRRASGGRGEYDGGDGVLKQWRFLAPARVALLAGRRSAGAPGLAGGGPGAPGRDQRDRGHGWEPAPPVWEAQPGDRLRVETPGGGGWGPPPSDD